MDSAPPLFCVCIALAVLLAFRSLLMIAHARKIKSLQATLKKLSVRMDALEAAARRCSCTGIPAAPRRRNSHHSTRGGTVAATDSCNDCYRHRFPFRPHQRPAAFRLSRSSSCSARAQSATSRDRLGSFHGSEALRLGRRVCSFPRGRFSREIFVREQPHHSGDAGHHWRAHRCGLIAGRLVHRHDELSCPRSKPLRHRRPRALCRHLRRARVL